jgi:hypothetical protein
MDKLQFTKDRDAYKRQCRAAYVESPYRTKGFEDGYPIGYNRGLAAGLRQAADVIEDRGPNYAVNLSMLLRTMADTAENKQITAD